VLTSTNFQFLHHIPLQLNYEDQKFIAGRWNKSPFIVKFIIIIIIIIIIGMQPLGQFAQRPELSQATGMTLVRCILGNFLRVVCHCFPQWHINYCFLKSRTF